MARGFLTGIVWGSLVGGLGLVSLSLMYPQEELRVSTPPEAGSQAPIAATGTDEETPAVMAPGSGTLGSVGVPSAPNAAPSSANLPSATAPLTQPMPDTGAGEAPATLADAGGDTVPDLSGTHTSPDASSPAMGPSVPAGEDLPQAGQLPSMPAAQVEGAVAGAPPTGGQGPDMAAATQGASADRVPGVASVTSPAGEQAPIAGGQPASPNILIVGAEAGSPPMGGQGPNIAVAEADNIPGRDVPGQASGANAENPPPTQVPPAALPDDGAGTEQAASSVPGTPGGQIGDLAANVTTNRLPSIGQTPVAATSVGVETALEPALRINAQSFGNPQEQPVMAVLLKDAGTERNLLGDLKNLPFPISFVVDAAVADAPEAIAFYRNAGAEVVLSVPLPEGATPTDVEVTMSTFTPLLNEAVAMMAPKDSGFQTMGPAATQVAVVLAASGHGLISIPQGLNTGHKSALKEGIAAGLIFRELDNDGQSGAVIRRFLDNAAFKARQNNGVILLGHARISTIQALIEWSLGNRAKTVALAPVSVVLAGQ